MERLISKYQWILGLFNSPFFIVSKSTHFRTKEGANIMKRYGYHRTSTREQHLDRGIKEIKNKVILKERDVWSNFANFIGEMVAKYAEAMDLDNLPNPDFYLHRERIRQLYTELYKEKNITKFRNTKISIEREVVA